MIQICYTNSNTSDVWDMFYEQNRKFCSYPLYLLSDVPHNGKKYKNIYIYKNTQPYWKTWVQTLEDINPEFFIYLQEDFVLYDKVNEEKINEYKQFLKENPKYSFVRLLKSGSLQAIQSGETLFDIESDNQNIFSMQPTIWRTSDFIKIYKEVKASKWFENETYVQKCIELNIKGLYHHNNEPKRGQNHYDSDVYPYIATALVKGKWNTSEYSKELNLLLKEYNINKEIRGTI
jgi:hypothetical protein